MSEVIEEKNMIVEALSSTEGRLILGTIFTVGLFIALYQGRISSTQFIGVFSAGMSIIASLFKKC